MVRRRGPQGPRRAVRRRGGRDARGCRSTSRWTRCCSGTPRRRSRRGCARWTSGRGSAARSCTSSGRSSRRRSRCGASGSGAPSRAPGQVLVWDLGRVNAKEIDAEDAEEKGVARMARARPLEAGEIYAGLVDGRGGPERHAWTSATRPARSRSPTSSGRASGTRPRRPRRRRRCRRWSRPATSSSCACCSGKLPVERAARERKPLALSLEQTPAVQGALVAIDPATRGIRALVGGYDFQVSQFNRATQAKRQPGIGVQAVRVGRRDRVAAVHARDGRLRHARPLPRPVDRQGVEAEELREDAFDGPDAARRRARPLEEHRLGEARRRARRRRRSPRSRAGSGSRPTCRGT